ncbi:hypothetical protein OTU49_012591, partial [Cherax quadricarinatus]
GGVKRKHQTLSIQEKVELLRKLDRGISVHKLTEDYGLGSSTVYDIKKQREKLLKFYTDSVSKKQMCIRKSMTTGKSSEHDRVMLQWFRKRQSDGVELSGTLIMEQARLFHKELKLEHECNYTDGWLQRFKNRHGISFSKVCGEKWCADYEGTADCTRTLCSQPSGQEEKKSPVVICLDLPDESCTIYKEISNVPENSQKKMRNEESMGGDVSETQKLDVSIKAKEGVWRSGRVRKRSSKLADFASTAEVDVLFRQYSDGPGSLHNDSN